MRRVPLALAATLAAALACAAGPARADTITLLDRPSGLGALPYDGGGRGNVFRALTTRSLSVDGRYLAFASTADDLLDGDDDSADQHIYRLDRTTGAIVQVDRAPDGAQTSHGWRSDQPTISADGRYVAFNTNGPDFGAPKGGAVYVKDLETGALELASVGTDGAPVAEAQAGVISGDGRHVAFAVYNHAAYLRSLDDDATQKFGDKLTASVVDRLDVAYDGRAVAFASFGQLTAGDTDAYIDMYVWRGAAGIVLVSRTETTASVDRVALSGDGELGAWDANGRVMAAAVAAGLAVEVSKPQPGGSGAGSAPAFERRNGALPAQRLDFYSSTNIVTSDTNNFPDLYSADAAHLGDPTYTQRVTNTKSTFNHWAATAAGTVAVVAAGSDRIPGSDGRSTQIWEVQPNTYKLLSIAPGVTRPADVAGDASIAVTHASSDDGARVALSTTASALGAERSIGYDRAYPGSAVVVRDAATNTTTLVSVRPDGTPATGTADGATIDAAGQQVAFRSDDDAVGAITGTGAGYTHGYLRDLATGTTTVVDRTAGGTTGNHDLDTLVVSADGRHVAFISRSDNLGGGTGDGIAHAYVKDLDTGTIELVDRSTAGTRGDEGVRDVDINGDGSRVAFTSPATNLGPNTDRGEQQAYVRDRAAGTTTWVSVPEDRDPAHVAAINQPSLDRAGDTVAYSVRGPQFGHGMPAEAGTHLFVTEVATGATELVDRDASGLLSNAGAPSLSADGRRVGFGSYSVDTGAYRLSVRDRTSQTTTARDVGEVRGIGFPGGLTGDGRCTVFGAYDLGPLPEAYGPDFLHVYRACDGPITQQPPPIGDPPGKGQPPVVWPSAPRDRTAPAITKAKLSARRFAVAKTRTASKASASKRKAAPKGTTIGFRLSERATITIKIVRRKGSKTVVTLTRAKVRAGSVKITYSGRTTSTVLKAGTYQAEIRATDAAGNRSKVTRLAFTVAAR